MSMFVQDISVPARNRAISAINDASLLITLACLFGVVLPVIGAVAVAVLQLFARCWPKLDEMAAWASRSGAGVAGRLVLIGTASLLGTSALALSVLVGARLTTG